MPVSLAVSQKEAALAETHGEELLQLGLRVERIGPETLAVRQVPALLRGADTEQLVRDAPGSSTHPMLPEHALV